MQEVHRVLLVVKWYKCKGVTTGQHLLYFLTIQLLGSSSDLVSSIGLQQSMLTTPLSLPAEGNSLSPPGSHST